MNSKRICFFFIIFSVVFISTYVFSENSSNWISHLSYTRNIEKIAQNGDYIYVLSDGKLFIYNRSDNSIEEYIKYERGNTDITFIAYNKKNKCLLVTRSDSNIELLFQDKSYKEITALKEYLSGQITDKTINNLYMDEDLAYLSTNFGFITIDISKAVIKETPIFNYKFYSVCPDKDRLYAATERGILSANKADNTLDPTKWNSYSVSTYYQDSDYRFKDSDIKDILIFKDKLHFLFPDSTVYVMESAESVKALIKGKNLHPFAMYVTNNDRLMIVDHYNFWEYTDLSEKKSLNINNMTYIIPNDGKQNEYWLASAKYDWESMSENYLSLIKANEYDFEYIKEDIAPNGPASNYPFSQTYGNNKLIVTGGGFYLDRYQNRASLSIMKNNKWDNINFNQIKSESGLDRPSDFSFSVSDPTKPDHIFVSSWGEGLYEFENGHLKNRYDKTNTNGVIEELTTNTGWSTTRIGGLAYDKKGNLWMVNSMVKDIVKVFLKNGSWEKLYYKDIDGTTVDTHSKKIFIDRYSNKWIISFGATNINYLFVLNDNGTISNTSDDKYTLLNNGEFTDKNNNRLDISMINDITEDNNGNIWLSTNIGPYWVTNSSKITTKDKISLNRITINKNTGSGSVTGLLENTAINSIAVDGANRKWIATQTSGIFLLSADNKEILKHFDLNNSPLPSNNIISLSIDSQNGYVYIGSDRGLMAYRSGASKGADDFSNVYVYPNPVRPDYGGVITVTGLKSNSHVKITDIKGNLITEGSSLGGQFVWDGINNRGRYVDTGVYLVFGASDDGTEGVVTKIVVVK